MNGANSHISLDAT